MNSFDTAEFAKNRYDGGRQNTSSSIYKNESGDYTPATSQTLQAKITPQMTYNSNQIAASQTLDFKNAEFKKMTSLISSAGNTSIAESDPNFQGYLKPAASSSRDGYNPQQIVQHNEQNFKNLNSESFSRSSILNKDLGRQESDLLTMNNLGSQEESHALTQAQPMSVCDTQDEAQLAREEAIRYLAATQPNPGQSVERRYSGMQDSLEPTSDVEYRRTTLTHDEIQNQAANIFPQNNLGNLSQIIIEDSQEDAYTRYTGHTQNSISIHDQTVSIKGVGHINQLALQASYGGAQSSIGGKSQNQIMNQGSDLPRESQMSYMPEDREHYQIQSRSHCRQTQTFEYQNHLHTRSAFAAQSNDIEGAERVIIEDIEELRNRTLNSALQKQVRSLDQSPSNSIQSAQQRQQQQIVPGNYKYDTNQYLEQIENGNENQNVDNSVKERSPEIRPNHHLRRSSGAQSHRPSRECGDNPQIQIQEAYQQASDVRTQVISTSIETFKNNDRLLNTNQNNNFAYNNNLVSENCRDSLDTYTYNTRFAQNPSDLVKSSHNFDKQNLLLLSSNQPVNRKIPGAINDENTSLNDRIASCSPTEERKVGDQGFGYQFNKIWQSQKNISQQSREGESQSEYLQNPNMNTNSSKVERSSAYADTFRNQQYAKAQNETGRDDLRAVDILNQSLKVMKQGNGNRDLPRPSNIQSSTNYEAVNYFGPKEYLAPLQMKQQQTSNLTRPSNIDSLNTQTVVSPSNGLSNVSFLEQRNRELEKKLNDLESQLKSGNFNGNIEPPYHGPERVSNFAQKYEQEYVRSRSQSQGRKVFSQERQVDSKLIIPLQVEPQNTTEGSMSMLIDGLNTQNFADRFGMTQESKKTLEELNQFNKMQLISAINIDSQQTYGENQIKQELPHQTKLQQDHFSFRAPGQLPEKPLSYHNPTSEEKEQNSQELTKPVSDLNKMLCNDSQELRKKFATIDDSQIVSERSKVNLNQAVQVRNFVERQVLLKENSKERGPEVESGCDIKSQSDRVTRVPNITNVKNINDRNLQRERKLSNEQIHQIQEKTHNVLKRSREISKSRSLERSFNQVDQQPPKAIHLRDPIYIRQTEPRGAAKTNLNSTQEVSQINSKYMRELRESKDSRLDQFQSNVGNENVYNDFIMKNQCSTPVELETPFSVVDATASNRESLVMDQKQHQTNKEQLVSVISSSNFDTIPEIQQAKSAFLEVQGQNQNLKQRLEQMQQKMQKLEEEKTRSGELNELKMQQFESKIKLLEIQNCRAEANRQQIRESEQIDREERRAWELKQERMIKEAAIAASEKINESNQNQTVTSDKTDEKILRLEEEIRNIHSHYQQQITSIEQNAINQNSAIELQNRGSLQIQNTRASQAHSLGYSEQTFDPRQGHNPHGMGSRGSQYNMTDNHSKKNSIKSNSQSKRSTSKKEIVIVSASQSVQEETAEAESQNQQQYEMQNEQSHSQSFEEVVVESGNTPSYRPEATMGGLTSNGGVTSKGGLSSVSPTQSQGISNYNFKEAQQYVNEYGYMPTSNPSMNGCSSTNLIAQQQKNLIHERSMSQPDESNISSQEIQVENQNHSESQSAIKPSNHRFYTNQSTLLGIVDNNFLPRYQASILKEAYSTQSTFQNQNLTFGEKQRLFEHIQHLEKIQADHMILIAKLQTENQILNRFRYTEITSQIETILPQCFENEIFMQWAKFIQVLNRCLKKCFSNGDIFKKGYLGKNQAQIWDTESLIKYIEKMVQNLQLIEKMVGRFFKKQVADQREHELKESHVKMIEMISESSLNLSQMPELYSQGNKDYEIQKEALEKVFTTLISWQRTIQLHLDFQVCEFRHQVAVVQAAKKVEPNQNSQRVETENDLDEFWSDFSDNDFLIDQSQERDELDILYNLQNWLTSNNDIDFMQIFRPFGDFDHNQGKNTFLISCSNFQAALEAAGYDFCEISLKSKTDFMCLIRAISCTQQHSILNNDRHNTTCWEYTPQGMINYKQFLQDIAERPFQWWSEKICSFLKEMQDVDDTSKIQDAMPPKRRALDAFQANLNKVQQFFPAVCGSQYDKFCKRIVMNRLADSKQSFAAIEESGKRCVTKGGLRKHILHIFKSCPVQRDQNGKINPSCVSYLNMSRLDCHILVKMIFQSNKQRIKLEQNPDARRQMKENHDRIDIYQLLDLTAVSKQQIKQDKFDKKCQLEPLRTGMMVVKSQRARSYNGNTQRSEIAQNYN